LTGVAKDANSTQDVVCLTSVIAMWGTIMLRVPSGPISSTLASPRLSRTRRV